MRLSKSSASLVQEGETYHTDVDLQTATPNTMYIPAAAVVSLVVGDGSEETVFLFYFFETAGFGQDSDIVQIAAVSGDRKYST